MRGQLSPHVGHTTAQLAFRIADMTPAKLMLPHLGRMLMISFPQEALRRFRLIAGIRRNVGVLRCEPLKETFAARATERSPSQKQILMSVNATHC